MHEWLWAVVRWVHLVPMAFWLGGQHFLVLVVRPVLRRELDRAKQTALTATLGRHFSSLARASLLLLVVTGWLNAEHRSVVWSSLLVPTASSYGRVLVVKMALEGILLFFCSFTLAQSSLPSDRRRYQRLLRLSIIVSTMNLRLTLTIIFLSARLVT